MNINATLFAQMIVFFLLWGIVAKFIWPKLIKALDERAEKIAAGLIAAKKSEEALELTNQNVQKMLFEAKEEGIKRVSDAEKTAKIVADSIKENANIEAKKIIDQAKIEIEQQVSKAKDVLRNEVSTLIIKGAEQILRREVDSKMHTQLLNQFKEEL